MKRACANLIRMQLSRILAIAILLFPGNEWPAKGQTASPPPRNYDKNTYTGNFIGLSNEASQQLKDLSKEANAFTAKGAYSAAARIWEHLVHTTEKSYGLDHPDTAISIGNLAYNYWQEGQYTKAEDQFKRVLAIAQTILGPDHLLAALCLEHLAGIYSDQGRYRKAEEMYGRVLAIRERQQGPDSLDVATSLVNLALAYIYQGQHGKTEQLLTRALAIREQTLGPEHRHTAEALNALAYLYSDQGLYSKAEALYRRALAIREKALGQDHPEVSSSLGNLGVNYMDQGQYEKSKQILTRALAIKEKVLGPDHPGTAIALNNLAYLHMRQGQYDKASELFGRALDIKETSFGPNHPDTAIGLNNLASSYAHAGQYMKAEPLAIRSLAIRERALGADHSDTASSLNNLADILFRRSQYDKAEALYLRALRTKEIALGSDHPETGSIHTNLAFLSGSQGQYLKARDYLMRGLTIETIFAKRQSTALPREERLALLDHLGNTREFAFTLAQLDKSGISPALYARLNRQGLLEEIEKKQLLLMSLPGSQKPLADELRFLTQQLSSSALTPVQRQPLRLQQAELERQLYRLLPELEPRVVTAEQVAAAIPVNGVLIEFQKYRPFYSKHPLNQRWGKPRYMALALQPNGSATAVQLGPADVIDRAIHRALQATANNNSDARALWSQVTEMVLKPVLPATGQARQWFLSPDGELNRVPFAAVPAPQQASRSLAEVIQLRLLTTGRDLLALRAAPPASQPPVIVTNPSYNRQGQKPLAVAASRMPAEEQTRSADLGSQIWKPLPATEQEGQQIGGLLGLRPVSGVDATTRYLQTIQSPKILHIASHGYFLPDKAIETSHPFGALDGQPELLRRFRNESPGLRSGLVLAGANQPDADPTDDGYLTAEETVNLPLKGTQLVVLSACSTGQGDIRTGEGLYGLQRSLTVAGARSTLLSLWKVDDAATAEFMGRYYQRLKAGEGRSEALAAVQKEFRDGLTGGGQWKEPYYWAAWQLVGDWKPIPRL